MANPVQPQFRLVANTKDITSIVADRLVSMRMRDETGNTSDMLEFVLADNLPSKPIAMPETGAALTLSLGYDSKLTNMGSFIVDELAWEGPPDRMIIRARSAAYDMGNDGAYHLQTHKVRSWKAGTTIGAMVMKVAKEHGMTGVVASSLANIGLPHVDQQDESDLNMLLRIAKKYDAVVKPSGNHLVMAKRGEFKSATGQTLTPVTINKSDCDHYHYSQQKRDSAGSVVAYWHSTKTAKRNIITVGSGEPVRRIKQYFQTQAEAVAAAKAELSKRSRAMQTMHIILGGNPALGAECKVTLTGFRVDLPTTWIAKTVEHILDPDAGYICDVELEQPDASAQNDVTVTVDDDTDDSVG
jgi:phage protein D